MYEIERVRLDVAKRAVEKPPFGPGFDAADAELAVEMLIEGTSVTDLGPDFCRFTLLGQHGDTITAQSIPGY